MVFLGFSDLSNIEYKIIISGFVKLLIPYPIPNVHFMSLGKEFILIFKIFKISLDGSSGCFGPCLSQSSKTFPDILGCRTYFPKWFGISLELFRVSWGIQNLKIIGFGGHSHDHEGRQSWKLWFSVFSKVKSKSY